VTLATSGISVAVTCFFKRI